MLNLPIRPSFGVGPILLGMRKENARRLLDDLGYPLSAEHGNLDYFCENAIQLEYEDEQIRFIGVSQHTDILCCYGDQDVFDISAESLFRLFAAGETNLPNVPPGETAFFPAQGLNLWEADEQYDYQGGFKRRIYAQVGVEKPRQNDN